MLKYPLMKLEKDKALKGTIREKLVMPVAFLSIFIRKRGPKDPLYKMAKSSLESLWEIAEILKD